MFVFGRFIILYVLILTFLLSRDYNFLKLVFSDMSGTTRSFGALARLQNICRSILIPQEVNHVQKSGFKVSSLSYIINYILTHIFPGQDLSETPLQALLLCPCQRQTPCRMPRHRPTPSSRTIQREETMVDTLI